MYANNNNNNMCANSNSDAPISPDKPNIDQPWTYTDGTVIVTREMDGIPLQEQRNVSNFHKIFSQGDFNVEDTKKWDKYYENYKGLELKYNFEKNAYYLFNHSEQANEICISTQKEWRFFINYNNRVFVHSLSHCVAAYQAIIGRAAGVFTIDLVDSNETLFNITKITNDSGHYKQSAEHCKKALAETIFSYAGDVFIAFNKTSKNQYTTHQAKTFKAIKNINVGCYNQIKQYLNAGVKLAATTPPGIFLGKLEETNSTPPCVSNTLKFSSSLNYLKLPNKQSLNKTNITLNLNLFKQPVINANQYKQNNSRLSKPNVLNNSSSNPQTSVRNQAVRRKSQTDEPLAKEINSISYKRRASQS
jgi:hypothetical protein